MKKTVRKLNKKKRTKRQRGGSPPGSETRLMETLPLDDLILKEVRWWESRVDDPDFWTRISREESYKVGDVHSLRTRDPTLPPNWEQAIFNQVSSKYRIYRNKKTGEITPTKPVTRSVLSGRMSVPKPGSTGDESDDLYTIKFHRSGKRPPQDELDDLYTIKFRRIEKFE